MPLEQKTQGKLKIIGGLALMVAGILGFVFGRSAKQRTLRVSFFILSLFSLSAGFYLFVDGTEDLAVGVVGQYNLDGPPQQTLVYPSPSFFKMSLKATRVQHGLRRLKFECPDGSKSFTVFRTHLGILGIPQKSITCDNGFPLLTYDPSKNFVMDVK